MFSAGLIAHVEAAYHDDQIKNQLCVPVPHPNTDLDWLETTLVEQRNTERWCDHPELMDWLGTSRLNLLRDMYAPMLQRSQVRERALDMIKSTLRHVNDRLEELTKSVEP